MLRHHGPVHVTLPYVTTASVPVGAMTIPAGEIVLAALTAAGRDPAGFTDPERLDLTRADAGHLAFGHGIHHCLAPHSPGWRAGSPSAHCSPGSRRCASQCRPTRSCARRGCS